MTQNTVNISHYLKETALKHPFKRAVVVPGRKDKHGRIAYTHLTFKQLDIESDRLAEGLNRIGITRGIKTILMVTPSIDFFTITFALFKTGAVPVVVDPGMGINRMLSCLQETSPEAFIGIPKAHVLRTLRKGAFKTVKTFVTVGKKLFWGGYKLDDLTREIPHDFLYQSARTKKNDTAAILFTTGSTGPAKGVVYTHGNFDAQIRAIQSHFNITDNEIDLPTFPLFALFDPALGMTAIVPDMDPTKPALVNPEKIIEAIQNHGVTNMFASPALLNRVGRYGKDHDVKLESMKRVVSAGAPVLPSNIKQFAVMLTDKAEVHTPYGATEAVPILSMASNEIMSETAELSEQGFGTCIGRPINNIDIEIIRISDDPIDHFSKDILVSQGDVGEIMVKGDLVTTKYFQNTRADSLSKILDNGEIWHRMGDLGWKDKKDRIWFCGRKGHRVTLINKNLYTIPCEAIFNNHPEVFRSALAGIGPKKNQTPVMCIELYDSVNKSEQERIKYELLDYAENSTITKDIKHVLFHDSFPVDIRHNSKIFREKLSIWAEQKIKK